MLSPIFTRMSAVPEMQDASSCAARRRSSIRPGKMRALRTNLRDRSSRRWLNASANSALLALSPLARARLNKPNTCSSVMKSGSCSQSVRTNLARSERSLRASTAESDSRVYIGIFRWSCEHPLPVFLGELPHKTKSQEKPEIGSPLTSY